MNIYMDIPIFFTKKPQSRCEYYESFEYPCFSTVYGALLSYIGEMDISKYEKTMMAIAIISNPEKNVVIRRISRFKNKDLTDAQNHPPIRQELYTNVKLFISIKGKLEDALIKAMKNPESINRFGALCLGESECLINELREFRDNDAETGDFLVKDVNGEYGLITWHDIAKKKNKWESFIIKKQSIKDVSEEDFVMLAS